MMIRAILCHHCAVELSEDDSLHYVFECHDCVISEHDLEHAVRRDPTHPEAHRLLSGPVETRRTPRARPAERAPARAPARRRAA